MVNIWLTIVMILFSIAGTAKDLGVHGQVFTIKELDLLQVIKTKLASMELNGKLMAEQQKLLNKTYHSLHNRVGINLPTCKNTRHYNYDPSFYWPTDLQDHNGRIFYKAFTKVNPFDSIIETRRRWVLFDGNDTKQIDWIKKQGVNFGKLILVQGSAIKLMDALKVPVYFDNQSRIVKKLAIKSLPAVINLQQKQITITEVALEG